MAVGVAVELGLGIATLVLVPLNRPSGVIPPDGRLVYVAHAVVGVALVVGASMMVAASRAASRVVRIGAAVGAAGVLLGATGGLLTVSHPARLAGLALMLLGSVVAGIAYLGAAMEATPGGS